MLLKSLAVKKALLTTVDESETLENALKILEDSGFRCVPVLDETGNVFRGNIYKMHIYRHKSQGGDMTLPVTHLIKNSTKYIPIEAPFFKVFFNIKDLPYIAILNENNQFYGILTHSKLLSMLSASWNIDVGSYVLTVTSAAERGDLTAMSKIISKYASIASCITLDIDDNEAVRRTLFTLPANTDRETVDKIVKHLERKSFTVPEIEDLRAND